MVSFFKNKTSESLIDSSKTLHKSPLAKGASASPKTPPLTPEPLSPPLSSLQNKVLIVAEPKEKRSDNIKGSEKSQISNDSESSCVSSFDSLTQMHTGNSLLSNVINGIGCMPASELPSWTSRAGGSLTTIPENSIILPTSVWGVAPSFDSDSESFESLERNIHYDNFEMVWDESNLENITASNDVYGSTNNDREANQKKMHFSPMYCQPCNDLSGNEQATDPGLRDIKDKSISKEINHCDVPKAVPSNQQRTTGVKLHKKTKKKSRLKGAIGLSAKHDNSLSSNKETVKEKSSHQQPRRKNKKKIASKQASRIEKLMTKRFHNKKKDERKIKKKEVQLSSSVGTQGPNKSDDIKKGRWKCTTDVKSGDTYFYHTGTKEVSWDQPESFLEWRVTKDLTTGKTCFVNRITKEATWTKPEGFQEWKEVIDATTGNTYYFNVISRDTSWIKPNEVVKSNENINIIDCNAMFFENEKGPKDIKAAQETGKENIQPNIIKHNVENDLEAAGIKENKTIKDEKNIVKITEDDTTKNNEISVERNILEVNVDVSQPPLREELALLLSKYCPDEQELNSHMIQISEGQEVSVIQAIEALVNETPFDELQLSISSYAKSHIRSMGEEPYDENLEVREKRGPPLTMGRSFRRQQTMNSVAFSLNSRTVSQVTGKSGLTNKTYGTAETFRMTNTTKVIHKDLGGPYGGDNITSKNDGQKLIFDMSYLQEDNHKANEKQKKNSKKNEPHQSSAITPIPLTNNPVKPTKGTTSHICVKEINTCKTSVSGDIESAYAADNDDEPDINSLNDGDDTISALSDSFGPSHSKRYRQEKRLIGRNAREKNMSAEFRQSTNELEITSQMKYNGADGRSDRNRASQCVQKVETNSKHAQHTSTRKIPNYSTHDDIGQSRIGRGRSRQAQAKFMGEDLLLPRYADTLRDDESSSWDDDTMTTNPSFCNAYENGGLQRYHSKETRMI